MISENANKPTISRPIIIFSFMANAIFAIAATIFVYLYFQANRDIEALKTSIATLQTELIAGKSDLAKEAARAAELKSDLNASRTDAQTLAAKSTQLQSEVQSKEQDLAQEKSKVESVQAALEKEKTKLPNSPVNVEMRRSKMKRGLVAILTNNSSKQLPLLVETFNPTTQTMKKFTLQIAPAGKVELGYQEGWQFASGDRIKLQSDGFEALLYTVQ